MSSIRRLAIVNRGEAAMRCLSAVSEVACESGEPITTIALYTEPDAASWFVREASEAAPLGPALIVDAHGERQSAYVDVDRLMNVLASVRADAVWVGWGFVAESAEFAERCEQAGITFVGPPSAVIRLLGDKVQAKQLAERIGIEVLPWSGGPVRDAESARIAAEMLGYPVLVKAAAGGGGHGIRVVRSESDLAAAFASAQSEADRAFGDSAVFVERQIRGARHVEVQVLADAHGTCWALGIRDCSIQRRNQKVIEESGCTALEPQTRERLCEAAIRLCQAAGYLSAGTIEFLLDPVTQRFMFMEVNTRLQVEHPVTEMTTGADLVKLQLHVASGGTLPPAPPPVRGFAIEARLNAEDPEHMFAPTPGRVAEFRPPSGPGIRVDTGVASGDDIAAEFDSMIAKIVAWGRDRNEALGRLRRGLTQSLVVIEGGMTNKAFLLSLAGRPEMRAGSYDNAWLDRLTASGAHLPPPDPLALLAAAIEVADSDQEAVQANFLASATRGRPALPEAAGHRVDLLSGGAAYRMQVHCLGHHDYRIITPSGPVNVAVRRLGRYERAMTCLGRRYRVMAAASGPRLLIEIDGVPHVITRDDGGQIRCPAPSFVVAVLVAPGQVVRAGDPLVVVESMKMESAITAPHAGVVRSVSARVNTQAEAGAPLVRLQPPDLEHQPTCQQGAADFSDLAGQADARTSDRSDRHRMLRAYLLGYDLGASEAAELGREEVARLASLPPEDPELPDEQELVEIFADVAALSRPVPDDESPDEDHVRSSHEYLLTYLAFLDTERSGTPDRFARQLRKALARYGVPSLARTPELEQAMLRLYRSVSRMPAAAPIVVAILDRWRQARGSLEAELTDERLALLDRLISSTQGRSPGVCDLAREVRFCYVDEPLLRRTRALAYAEIGRTLDELCGKQDPERIRELTRQVVWFPLPMRSVLRDRFRAADTTASARLLEARTLRFYRVRELTELRCEAFAGHLSCLADYHDAGPEPVHLVTGYVPLAELPEFARSVAAHLSTISGSRPVVVDIESWRSEPFEPAGEMASELDELLAETRFGRDLSRLTITVTSEASGTGRAEDYRRTQSFSYRQEAGAFVEEPLLRNMHPMIADRMELWRLSNFSLNRLASAEDVYLFDAVAHANPQDDRLIALAEVRDLTPARDSAGAVIGYPHMEGMLKQALADIRRALHGRPPRQRPMNNRVILYVRPVWDIPTATWRSLAHRLAPLAADLGLEKVVVKIRRVDPATGEPVDAVLDVENVADRAVAVRLRAPADRPIRSLTQYRQKSSLAQRRSLPYPYDLIRMLTPPPGAPADFPAGDFAEYDLLDETSNELAPVSRPYGCNRAGIVVGVITNYTALVPEGVRRVAIIGDPTSGLGNLAEPECRRILGALDLAQRMRLPAEWFALSSGAKIAWDSGTENMDWIAAVLRRLIEFTQSGGEVNVVVTGINVGAQPYWNAEATMLMHTRGVLIMTPASAMVLTGKSSLDYSGGVSAEDNLGIGGFERIMGPNGQAQYWAPTLPAACELLLRHYEHTYIVPGERHPRRASTGDPTERDICTSPHKQLKESEFTLVGDIFSADMNADRKKPFDMRSVMRAVTDSDHQPFERWAFWRDAESAIVWEAHIGGFPVCLIGLESRTVTRAGFVPADGPPSWTSGTLFPQSSRKLARAINAASGNRPVVVLANLTGFDGSPESMRKWQLEYGAEIGRAVTNFDGPILFVVVSRYHGGAFVVFSKRLHEDMTIAALSGSFASVIGGAPAAAVVLSREVTARTDADPRVAKHRALLEGAAGRELADLRHELADVVALVRAEKLKEVADEFDSIHDIERALRVGSVDRIISPSELRPFVISALESRLAS